MSIALRRKIHLLRYFPFLRRAVRVSSQKSADQICGQSSFKYTCEVREAINQQITCEQQAGQDYLGMANVFGHSDVARRGCYNFFMVMYEEELRHMRLLIAYQLMRGGFVRMGNIRAPQTSDDLTMLGAFRKALNMEHIVTQKLEDVVVVAEKMKDYQCADYITSDFLQEQMKSIQEISTLMTILARVNDTEHGLYHFDLDLEKRYPYDKKGPNL